MGASPPKILRGIRFIGYQVQECSFDTPSEPKQGEKGYVRLDVGTGLDFEPKEAQSPDRLLVLAKLTLKGCLGDLKRPKTDDPIAFTLLVDLLMRYSTEECEGSVKQLRNCRWYFDSHAKVLLHSIVRRTLAETPFLALTTNLQIG